jgi:hypothetical protein
MSYGTALRILTLIDEFRHERLTIDVAVTTSAERVRSRVFLPLAI